MIFATIWRHVFGGRHIFPSRSSRVCLQPFQDEEVYPRMRGDCSSLTIMFCLLFSHCVCFFFLCAIELCNFLGFRQHMGHPSIVFKSGQAASSANLCFGPAWACCLFTSFSKGLITDYLDGYKWMKALTLVGSKYI